jgi:2-methylcitrate dehydratase
MAGDTEKWHPTNRETADHSMPYTTAVALTYGTINAEHFEDAYLHNPDLLALTGKVNVRVSEEANRRAPEAMLCKMAVVTHAGQRYTAEVAYHKGHYKNPLSDAELEEKFHSLAGAVLSPSQADALLERLWHLEDVTDMGEVVKLTQMATRAA